MSLGKLHASIPWFPHHAPSHAHTDKRVGKAIFRIRRPSFPNAKLVRDIHLGIVRQTRGIKQQNASKELRSCHERARESRARYCQSASKSRNEKWQLGVKYNWHWFDAKTFFREGLFGLKGTYMENERVDDILWLLNICVFIIYSQIYILLCNSHHVLLNCYWRSTVR